MTKPEKPLALKFLNIVCSFAFLAAIGYLLVIGRDIAALMVLASAFTGLAAPVVIAGEGILEILVGIAQAIFEGVVMVVEGICTAISSIFSF